jgi:hypothetical protein
MARGWESKSVESQIEDRNAPHERPDKRSREERDRAARRHSVEMSRPRIARELETARSDAHRSVLQNALAHLDGELRKLGET